MNTTIFYVFWMILAGLGIPLMAALNSGLGARLHSPALAAVILLTVAWLIAVSYWLLKEGLPTSVYRAGIPWYYYGGGFFVMFYILSITWVAPQFGVANAVSFVLLGQLIAMSLIDHFGFTGAAHYPLNLKRFAGLLIMVLGVFLVLSKPQDV